MDKAIASMGKGRHLSLGMNGVRLSMSGENTRSAHYSGVGRQTWDGDPCQVNVKIL